MEIMGNGVFFVVEREVLKAPPAAMDAFDEEKHHAVITLSLWTAFEYWQSCARLFHPPFCHEVLAAEGQNCCTTDDGMEYGPPHCTTLPSPLLPVGLLVHITKHSHSPAITFTSIQLIAVQNHTTSIVCAQCHFWLKDMVEVVECVFFVCLFLLCFMEIFGRRCRGIGLLWEAVSLFLSTCFWNALQSYLLFPLMSCLVLLITSTQFRGMSWEKLETHMESWLWFMLSMCTKLDV